MATWNGTHALEHQQNKCLWPEMLSNSSVDASVLFKVLFNLFPSADNDKGAVDCGWSIITSKKAYT